MKRQLGESEQRSNMNIKKTLDLTRAMLALADEGDRDRLDDSCGILYGLLRDMAYQLRQSAEAECEKHREQGRWED